MAWAGKHSSSERLSKVSKFKAFISLPVGRKILMGLTGVLLIGFLIVHMTGNLLVLAGPEAYNHYSHALVSNPAIYAAEVGLLALFAGHLLLGIIVTLRNRSARPVPYAVKERAGHTSRKSLASTTMIYSGLVLLVFVPLHIWTFKFGPVYESSAAPGVRDIYRLVVEIFQSPAYVVGYILALVIIGCHAWHGFGSAFESMGVGHRAWLRNTGRVLTLVIIGGFLTVPIAVYFFHVGGGCS